MRVSIILAGLLSACAIAAPIGAGLTSRGNYGGVQVPKVVQGTSKVGKNTAAAESAAASKDSTSQGSSTSGKKSSSSESSSSSKDTSSSSSSACGLISCASSSGSSGPDSSSSSAASSGGISLGSTDLDPTIAPEIDA